MTGHCVEWIPATRQKATESELQTNAFAVVDHLPFEQCLGAGGSSFFEVKNIPTRLHQFWAEAFGDTCAEINTLVKFPQTDDYERRLKRRIKMKFLLPFLILRKPPTSSQNKAHSLLPLLAARLNKWDSGEWGKLVSEYEANITASKCQQNKSHASTEMLDDIKFP